MWRHDSAKSRTREENERATVARIGPGNGSRQLAAWAELLASGRADAHKEKQLLAGVLTDFLYGVLGDGPAGGERYTISREQLVGVDGKFADAVLRSASITTSTTSQKLRSPTELDSEAFECSRFTILRKRATVYWRSRSAWWRDAEDLNMSWKTILRFSPLLIVLIIIGVGAAFVVRSVQFQAGHRTCRSHVKQISLALHSYHDRYGSFPPAYALGDNGERFHSWRVLLLPFLGHEDLYREYRWEEPWNGPYNRLLAERCPDVYRCEAMTVAASTDHQTSRCSDAGHEPHCHPDSVSPGQTMLALCAEKIRSDAQRPKAVVRTAASP